LVPAGRSPPPSPASQPVPAAVIPRRPAFSFFGAGARGSASPFQPQRFPSRFPVRRRRNILRVRDKCPARRSIIAPAHSGHGPPRSQDTLTCRGCTARPHNEGESSFLRLSEEGIGMTEIRGSAFVQKLFHTTSYAWVWLLLRLWLGWHW